MGITDTLATWIINLINATGYLGIFLAMLIESCMIPLPSEVTMPFAGAVAGQGNLNLLLVTLAGGFGNLVGSIIAYFIGYKAEEGIIRKFIKKWGKWILLSEHEYDKAKDWLKRYGNQVSFFSRLLPGVRTVISLPAGVAKINFIQFCIYTFLGSIIWSFLLAFIGFKLGERWEVVRSYFHKFDLVIVIAGLIAVGIYIYLHIRKKKNNK